MGSAAHNTNSQPIKMSDTDESLQKKMCMLNLEPEAFNYDAIAVNMLRFQLNYLFSDENLCLDNYLLSRLRRDSAYWVSLDTVASLSKIASITEDQAVILKAIRSSDQFLLHTDASSGSIKMKRKDYVPPRQRHRKNMRRTAFLYGLAPADATVDAVTALCSPHGKLNAIAFDDDTRHVADASAVQAKDVECVDRRVAELIMASKLDVPQPALADHRSCFVVFASQSQCSHFVKARRNELPRALHQYEFTKWQRKESLHRARGISPLSLSESRSRSHSQPLLTDPMDFYLSNTGGPATWSHADAQRRHTADAVQDKSAHFDFEAQRVSHAQPRRNSSSNSYSNSRARPRGHVHYGGSRTMTHRDMSNSWRKNESVKRSEAGHVPPSPSPNYFKVNRKGNIGIATNVPRFVMVQQKRRHQSPATTPTIASFSGPRDGRGILNRASY